jgi:hypothetical protein
MNHLAAADVDANADTTADTDGNSGVTDGVTRRWRLPSHARLVVYDAGDEELLTVYDCGVAQTPPSAQLRGHVVRIDASHRFRSRPTGYVATLHERATLIDQGDRHWVVRADD